MDHHVPRAITNGLRLRGVDVLTAHEDGASELRDPGYWIARRSWDECCLRRMMICSPKQHSASGEENRFAA